MSGEADGRLTDGSEYDGRYMFDRRKLLSGLGTVGAMAVAGCSGGGDDTTTTGSTATMTDTATATATETMQQTETQDEGGMDAQIDSRFGYTGTASDETPPVEPDHTVELNIRPRQDREIPEFFFEPVGLAVEPGDTVRFQLNTPHHNVNAYHPGIGYNRRIPEGVAPFSSPILTVGDYWLYTFEEEGVYDYMCAPHEVFGMVGRIVVGSATGPGASPIGEAPGGERTRVPEFGAALVLGDDAIAPETVLSEGRVSWDAIADENKRLTLAPTEAAPARDGGGGGESEGGGEMTPSPTPDGG